MAPASVMAMDELEELVTPTDPKPASRTRRVMTVLSVVSVVACLAAVTLNVFGRSSGDNAALASAGEVVSLGDMDITCHEENVLFCCNQTKKSGFYCVTLSNSTVTNDKITLTCLHKWGIHFYEDDCASLKYMHQSCFPGQAQVEVESVGARPMASLVPGDRVRVSSSSYEPVLGFLHTPQHRSGPGGYMHVTHSCGQFRATENHLVFVKGAGDGSSWTSRAVGGLRIGDELVGAGDEDGKACSVLSVSSGITELGLHSPYTASGTIVVDGVVASVYGQPSKELGLPHSLAHTFFFPVRLCHAIGFCGLGAGRAAEKSEEFHPYINFMYNHLRLDKLLPAASPNL